jgi:uncharacterized membrane protein YedE/YeeE
MKVLMSLITGIVFGIGLVISGMTNPAKVIGFLDITGNWDYSLALVMGGAVVFNFFAFKLIKKRRASILGDAYECPTNRKIDKKLINGSALFGIGWGLIGICPGPGIVNLVNLDPSILLFVISMLIGMGIYKQFEKYLARRV